MASDTSLENNPGVAFLEGLLAAIAVSTLSAGQLDLGGAAVLACVVVLAWQSRTVHTIAQWAFGLIGMLASFVAIVEYLSGDGCVYFIPLWGRVLILGGFAVAFAWGFMHTVLLARRFREVAGIGLGWFGLIELMAFASMAAGVSGQAPGVVVVIVGVLVLGYLLGARPTLAVLVIGVGMALVTLAGSAILGTAASLGTECMRLHNASGAAFIYLVAFVPATFFWVILIKPFVKRRS